MISNYCPRRESLRNVHMLLPLLFLASLVCACGSSITSGSSPTPTSTQGIKGIFHEFALPPSQFVPGTITAGPDGNLWFTVIGTNNGPSEIGVITPQGKIHEFTLSHSILGSITRGPDGNLWFTQFQYDKTGTTAGKIGSITTAGKISDFPLPTSSNSPTSITSGTDHTLWFIEVEITLTNPLGTNGKIGHLV